VSERRTLGLVVPMFNEEARLVDYGKRLLDFIAQQPFGSELVFVDDGSADGTVHAVEELLAGAPGTPARLIRGPRRGKGATVALGLAQLSTDYGGFCDLDLSTPLEHFERVVEAAVRAPVLAIASRDLLASRLVHPESRAREALGRAYNRLLQATLTPGVVDTQCGAKVAARSVWDLVLPHVREAGFAWDAELVAVAHAQGIEIVEVPVEWSHDDRSHVNVGRDGIAMVLATPRIWRRTRRVRLERRRVVLAREVQAGEVFDDANAARLTASDRSHWWFRSKAALVSTALRRTARHADGWLVDAGGGAGGVTAMLGWNPDRTLVVEGNATLAAEAKRRHGFDTARSGVDRLPLADAAAGVVCLLDVIEHLDDPLAALHEARRVLAPGGVVIVNVPAHEWLWSASDEVLGHRRRYTRAMLRAQLVAAGLEPVVSTHVFSWLVLPVFIKRRVASHDAELGLDQTSALIDFAAMVLTRLERSVVGRVSLPLGTSVLCVARPVASSET
jgi:dolichyl-phosphate beta-glucosyltransferase